MRVLRDVGAISSSEASTSVGISTDERGIAAEAGNIGKWEAVAEGGVAGVERVRG